MLESEDTFSPREKGGVVFEIMGLELTAEQQPRGSGRPQVLKAPVREEPRDARAGCRGIRTLKSQATLAVSDEVFAEKSVPACLVTLCRSSRTARRPLLPPSPPTPSSTLPSRVSPKD